MRVAVAEPDRADYQRDLSISYNRLAATAEKAGDRAAAHEHLSADLEIARRPDQADPDQAAEQRTPSRLGREGLSSPRDQMPARWVFADTWMSAVRTLGCQRSDVWMSPVESA